MSAADEAWQEWLNSPEQEFKTNHDRASFMAGAKWALVDAANYMEQPHRGQVRIPLATSAWLRARAAAVAPRETKDDR